MIRHGQGEKHITQLCPNRIIRLLIVLVAVLALAACAPIQTEMESGPPAAPPPAEAPLPQVQLPPVPEFSPAECNALLPIASDFTRADDYAGAIELFDIVLGCTDSDDLKAGIYFMRAESNMQRGDWTAAVDDYRQALALGLEAADAAGARNNICWFYALDGQAEVALPFCEQAVAASPTSSYLDSRGLAYALLGRSEDAVTDFEAALVDWAASDNPQIQAIAAQRQGWVDALRAGEAPITPLVLAELRAEDAPGVQVNLASAAGEAATEQLLTGRRYHMTGGFDRAVEAYSQAIELDPNYAPAYFYRGLANIWLEEWRDALADMQQVALLDPAQPFAHHVSGLIYMRQEDYAEAVAAYGSAIELRPDQLSFRADRAAAYFALGEPADALDDLDAVLLVQPDSAEILFMRGVAHRALENRGQAISDLERALELGLPAALQQQAEAALRQLREGFF